MTADVVVSWSPIEGAGAPEIEITPEMIEAGLTELVSWTDDSHVCDDCISAVYAAMERARLAGPHRVGECPPLQPVSG